jgi:hypothetical protein
MHSIDYLGKLQAEIQPFRDQVVQHKLYEKIKKIDHLRLFMEHHVFAVWDFMSLLKSLQIQLTCVSIPWVPKGSGAVRYLINEIVTGEESDVDTSGNATSHYELYLQAMHACGASTAVVEQFVSDISEGKAISAALEIPSIPTASKIFVQNTFDTIQTGKAHIIAAVFTMGREDLIPEMFLQIVNNLTDANESTEKFKYYLERHIELDGDHHSKLAFEMLAYLCGEDAEKWAEATHYVATSLTARKNLWDAVEASIAE